MSKTETYTSPQTGKVYSFSTEIKGLGYRPDPYTQVNVYDETGTRVNFGITNLDPTPDAILQQVKSVVEWDETPNSTLAQMSSRYD